VSIFDEQKRSLGVCPVCGTGETSVTVQVTAKEGRVRTAAGRSVARSLNVCASCGDALFREFAERLGKPL
jgi:hypothetical protein